MTLADGLRRGAALLALVLLGSCGPARTDAPAPSTEAARGVCRIGPDGGPPLADRGIGGTGAPSQGARLADRGIGGTGIRPGMVQEADRGIGGTGIVAVITGFASICLGGREVALEEGVPVTVEGAASEAASLRAGQVAVVEAVGPGAALQARRVQVRYEVSGPVEAVEPGGLLRVMGQRVALTPETLGQRAPQVGQWVAVSGLRRPDGVVVATRLDRRLPGMVTVHGQVQREGGILRIGTLELRPGTAGAPSGIVTASGRYADGVLYLGNMVPDLVIADPAVYFGPGVGIVLFEAYSVDHGDRLRLGPGLEVAATAGLGAATPRRAVIELERREGGTLRATGLWENSQGHGGFGRGSIPGLGDRTGLSGPSLPGGRQGVPFEPAPVPNRMPSFDAPRDGIGGGRLGNGPFFSPERGSPGAGTFGSGGGPGGSPFGGGARGGPMH
ncbi:DUF5666 domain-containing protein [Paracraurococcus lichenis]|uniref:DUF5666 domain-containing protein n=1 Tax=Paracraurococcus lichenis TaxID=3064888 RepID=A0ABT9ECU8_9PROT|nr:DUF5666 domain-containing protein [Paracraurococcus sp. LOR1-02]MDO9714051.1 DUF5666 domain-containing protein [Paracraurococcus sp. LOR1-02]